MAAAEREEDLSARLKGSIMSDATQAMPQEPLVLHNQLQDTYSDALLSYLVQPEEPSLAGAQRLGQKAVGHGVGLPQMAAIHHESLRLFLLRTLGDDMPARPNPDPRSGALRGLRSLLRSLAPEESTAAVKAAETFFTESLQPFEASHRQFQDATAALHRQNRRMEEQAGRIARELYDESMQLLAAAHLTVHAIANTLPADGQQEVSRLGGILDQIEAQLARFSFQLRPSVLDQLGLDAAISCLAGYFTRMGGTEIQVEATVPRSVPAPLAIMLYRSVQEALSNISAHACATHVGIRLQERGEGLLCSIRDNGIGFDASEVLAARGKRGLGLVGIQENVRAFGGTLTIQSSPGNGTELRITVPLKNKLRTQ
ncbi:MAG: hypothetical protein LAP87_06345 [Acidobacteriia bacterium]|nr:hypothetical protein [Terriglobia bacterium]